MRRTGAVALVLVLVAGACGDDGGDSSDDQTIEAGEGAGTGGEVTEAPLTGEASVETIDLDVLAELPPPTGSTGGNLALAGWDGGAVIVGPAGGLVELGPDGAAYTATEGIDPGDEGTAVNTVEHLAAVDDSLLAIGRHEELVADVFPSAWPVAWRSTDAVTWESVPLDGIDAGSDPVSVQGVTTDGDAFVAYGDIDTEDDGAVLALWRSADGETWEQLDADGLDAPPEPDVSERLVSLAVADDTWLAVREETGLDDSSLRLMRSADGTGWEEIEFEGLEALDLANDDVLPSLAAVGGEFVIFASVATDPDDERGDRTPTLFRSGDGSSWEATELDGPTLDGPFSPQAIAPTATGAAGLTAGEESLDLWSFPS